MSPKTKQQIKEIKKEKRAKILDAAVDLARVEDRNDLGEARRFEEVPHLEADICEPDPSTFVVASVVATRSMTWKISRMLGLTPTICVDPNCRAWLSAERAPGSKAGASGRTGSPQRMSTSALCPGAT